MEGDSEQILLRRRTLAFARAVLNDNEPPLAVVDSLCRLRSTTSTHICIFFREYIPRFLLSVPFFCSSTTVSTSLSTPSALFPDRSYHATLCQQLPSLPTHLHFGVNVLDLH